MSPPTISPANTSLPEIKSDPPKYLLNLESKFTESKLSENKFSEIKFSETIKFSEDKFSETKFSDTSKFSEISKFTETTKFLDTPSEDTKLETKLVEPENLSETKPKDTSLDSSPPEFTEIKYSDSKDYVLHKISPKDNFEEKSLEVKNVEFKRSDSEEKEDISEEKFSRLDDSFIPPFNNPVYPNSAQYTGYTSVIGESNLNFE